MNEYKNFSDADLIKAVELLISKDDLKIREVAELLLSAFAYTENEINDQLNSGKYLSDAEPLHLL